MIFNLKHFSVEVFMATIEFNPIKKRDQKLKFWFFDETSKQ